MICRNCGYTIPDNSYTCPYCNAPVAFAPQNAYPQPAYTAPQPAAEPAPAKGNATPILVFGLLGFLFPGVLLSFIFSVIALSKAKAYTSEYGDLPGAGKAGKVFGTLGLIFAIIALVLIVVAAVLYLLVIIFGLSIGAGALPNIFEEVFEEIAYAF